MKERILSFMEDMHTLDAERVGNWFTEDATLWIPPARNITGISKIKALFRAMFGRYESLSWTILEIIPVGTDRCIHICKSHGCLKGCEEYNNYVMTDILFNEEGKIVSLSDFFKDTSVFIGVAKNL